MANTHPVLGFIKYAWGLAFNGWHTENDANLVGLGVVTQLSVLSRTVAAQPGAPANGVRYIIPTGATGAQWSGNDGKVAAYIDATWRFYTPTEGWTARVIDEGIRIEYSGAAWVSITPLRIAVLGDSLSAQSYAWADMWPSILERNLNQNGIKCEVRSFSKNTGTFFRINTQADFGAKTALQKVVDYQPDIVIVPCGFNDAVQKEDSRSQSQIKADALETFQTLRADIDNCKIFYGRQLAYDNVNFAPTTLKNKGVIPAKMTLNSAGILASTYNNQILETVVDSATQDAFTDWVDLDSYIAGLSELDGIITFDGFKLSRLGLFSTDGLHLTSTGHIILGGDVTYQLRELQQTIELGLSDLADQNIDEWENLDSIFDAYLEASGDGFVINTTSISNVDAATMSNLHSSVSIDNFFMPYKGALILSPKELVDTDTNPGQFSWHISGAKPFTKVELSINGSAFFDLTYTDGSVVLTDSKGNATSISTVDSIVAAFSLTPPTTITALFKIADMVFQEISIDVTA